MCTLIVIHRRIHGAPLVVAANRDEFYDRPAEAPALMQLSDGSTILAPRDLRAGGTWLGLNQDGVFAAITNRPNPEPDSSRRSRGLLVLDALAFASAEKAATNFESLGSDLYNPFNLFVADRNDAFAVVHDDSKDAKNTKLTVNRLEPGVHVIGNADPNDLSHPKTCRTLEAVESLTASLAGNAAGAADLPSSDRVLAGLGEICRSHDGTEGVAGPLGATCVHHEGYGTRSSILLQLSEDPQQDIFQYADGAPCTNPYENLTPLLHELSRVASYEGFGSLARKAS